MRFKRQLHRNPNGHLCRCPWGVPKDEEYVPPAEAEKYGKTAMWHEASKAEWLRNRDDVQKDPNLMRFLERMEEELPAKHHDALYPWLLRHYKARMDGKPGIAPVSHHAHNNSYADPDPFTVYHDTGESEGFGADDVDTISDWMKYMKQSKQGVNIDKYTLSHALEEARKYDIGGETVHDFSEHEDAPGMGGFGDADGWKMVRLRNKRDLRREGKRMNHCIGSNGQGYYGKLENGKAQYYSLRDPKNKPHATLEMGIKQDHYYKCPECKKFALGDDDIDYQRELHDRLHVNCEHCGHTLASGTYKYSLKPHDNVEQFENKVKPTDHDYKLLEAKQLFGFGDKHLDDWHESLVNHFLSTHGHPYQHSDGDYDDEEEEPEPEFEPWWEDYYSVPGATTVDEYHDYINGEHYDRAPEEYNRAVRDASEHGLTEPELDAEGPDHDAIWDDLVGENIGARRNGIPKVKPEEIARFFKAAEDQGDGEYFRDKALEWIEEEYNSYTDPYGQGSGITNRPKGINTPPDQQPATWMEGTQYPESIPDEEYFKRNLEHHLEPYRNPQTGEYDTNGHSIWMDYPHVESPMRPELREEPQEDPPPNRDGPNRTPMLDTWEPMDWGRHRPGYGQQDYNQPHQPAGFPGTHRSPMTQEQFDQGEPRTDMHQRPIPGMPPPPRPQGVAQGDYHGWHGDPAHWPGREQQGAMFPQHWYLDRSYRNLAHPRFIVSQLPPHLFPPERYHHVVPDVLHGDSLSEGQVPLWEQPSYERVQGPAEEYSTGPVTPYSLINTQTPMSNPADFMDIMGVNQRPPQPQGYWHAKKHAGPWTDYEENRVLAPKQKRSDPSKVAVPHHNGKIVQTRIEDPYKMPNFEWRIPVVYDKTARQLIVGQPGMEHADMMRHVGKPNPWGNASAGHPNYHVGYIDTQGAVGNPGLYFMYGAQPPDADLHHEWIEQQFGIPRPKHEVPPSLQAEPLNPFEATYHPLEEDEWVAEDEPVFSALIPEPRWKS